MEILGTPPPSPSLACGRRRPASKPKEADFLLPHKVARSGSAAPAKCLEGGPDGTGPGGRGEAVMGAGGGPYDAIHPIEGPEGVVRPVQALGRAGHPRFWPAPEERQLTSTQPAIGRRDGRRWVGGSGEGGP